MTPARRGARCPRPIRCGAASCSTGCRIVCFSTAPRRARGSGRYSFLTADPVAVVRSRRRDRERRSSTGGQTRAVARRRARRRPRAARAASRRAGRRPAAVPGRRRRLPRLRLGAARSSACRRRATTTSRSTTWCSASTTGCWRGTTSRREAWLISTGMPETAATRARAPRRRARARPVRERGSTHVAARRQTAPRRRSTADASTRLPARARAVVSRRGRLVGRRLALRSSFTHAGYLDAVARVREYIFAGDIFQANLSQRFEAPLAEPPWTLYRASAHAERGALRRVPRLPGRAGAERVARALPARGRRRARRDAADQGHARRAASAPSTTPRSARRSPRARRTGPRT